MRYRKLTEIEKLELKDRHQGKQDRRICDRIKAVLPMTTGYNVIEISDILLLSHEWNNLYISWSNQSFT